MLEDCTFINNTATWPSLIHSFYNKNATVWKCRFIGNNFSGEEQLEESSDSGKGLLAFVRSLDAKFDTCLFKANTVSGSNVFVK